MEPGADLEDDRPVQTLRGVETKELLMTVMLQGTETGGAVDGGVLSPSEDACRFNVETLPDFEVRGLKLLGGEEGLREVCPLEWLAFTE